MSDSNEKKVIVLSPAGSKVKASDITRVSSDVQGDISDPMKSRDTETGTLKKVDAAADPGKSKMTIKLKPLKPREAPQDESQNKAPIPMESFKTSATISPADLQGNKEDDETVKIDKKPRPSNPPESGATSIPGAKQTIKLRPSSTTPSGAESEGAKPSSPSTMKLRPINVVQNQSTPSESAPGQIPQNTGSDDEQTVAMQKRTIKLMPTKPSAESQPVAAPTVRLTSSTSVRPPAPSIPTLKLTPTDIAQAPIQQAPPPAPSQEEELPPPQEPVQQQASAPKRTLKLRSTHSTLPAQQPVVTANDMSKTGQQLAVSQENVQESSEMTEKGTDEPSIIFTIAASVAFLTLAYFSWMTIGQFGEEYLGWQTANVPGLSGKVK